MRWIVAPCLALSLLTGTAVAATGPAGSGLAGTSVTAPVPEPEIWFNPHGTQDFLNMWAEDAPWQHAARKVNVLILVDWWIRGATDAQLIQILDFARRHHMQIDLDTQAVAVYSFQGCGQGEGYSLLGSVGLAVQRLANLGANVEWFDMDGPLYHGHYDTGPIGCQLSIPDTITRTVQNMKDVLAVYPHAKLIDGEPCPAIAQLSPTWQADLTEFYTGLAQQLGTPVRGLQLDVNWDTPSWAQAMVDINTYLHYQNMGLGVIWDGTANNTTDADWINAAISHFEAVEGRLQIIPQEAIFTTWDANPADNLPETSPTAQTWLINRYFRPRSTIQAQFVGLGAQGTLTDMAGNPIPNVTVNGYKPGVDFSQPLPVTTVTGVVPAGAVQAGIVVRVNTECAGCNGLNDLLYGTMQYQETQGGSAQASFSTINLPAYLAGGTIVTTEIVGGTQVQRIIASPGQIAMWNGPAFPVTAGAQYQFTVPAGTIGGLGWFGNVDLIWLNSSVAEMARVVVTPDPGKALMSTAITNPDGTFALFPMPRSVDGPNPVTVEFDGANGTYRSSVWTPLQ